jgi:hypothetical protein
MSFLHFIRLDFSLWKGDDFYEEITSLVSMVCFHMNSLYHNHFLEIGLEYSHIRYVPFRFLSIFFIISNDRVTHSTSLCSPSANLLKESFQCSDLIVLINQLSKRNFTPVCVRQNLSLSQQDFTLPVRYPILYAVMQHRSSKQASTARINVGESCQNDEKNRTVSFSTSAISQFSIVRIFTSPKKCSTL